ncbi:MAG: hypothetical protein A2504_07070 [Bdellovibrionales bacterium RIFOXYD12_FULL_39_22]|nr:MAG: hypothetical protein A2385_05285 [Bdellovibrionales bacterium RIFOXYB1_FULL_39_21]OFZ44336.1 MAG: hypothetical protein A2485_16065 [Bdellovibrionales bacterium RIFOXYC12_FULL_39_17]OFZ49191.1 MAG: hypothetical protein A2404_16005 [Bdellovibrionales bacterium RIFOXYC1_FULL_39_130]OFZ76999.1 MAG: hypothetical protein A2560_11090 [Bdellovibrionales bacterium RIFOXYD1_FULL_39_84]OFZ95212.1 MAG: hypothetical protein A2504_07070 [Bdellovibrionales bacterium RIFOXYD12_FULL_39_22]HLE09635.1 re
MIHILLVEDDQMIARGIQINLELEGYKFSLAENLKMAFDINQTEKINLVVLDIGLPDGSGFEFLKKIRGSGSRLPIIILTAQTDEDFVVEGLQLGANDYMRKPFGNKELLARIKTALKEPQRRDRQLRFEDLLIIIEKRKVMFGETLIDLNPREFDILLYMIERADSIITRESLLQVFDKDGEIFDRTIDSHVSHLRASLKKMGVTSIKISSVYGIGYRLEKAL